MSLMSSLFAVAALAIIFTGTVTPAHAGIAIDPQKAAKAKEPALALQCALTPYHIWIYNPNPALVGYCADPTSGPPALPDRGYDCGFVSGNGAG